MTKRDNNFFKLVQYGVTELQTSGTKWGCNVIFLSHCTLSMCFHRKCLFLSLRLHFWSLGNITERIFPCIFCLICLSLLSKQIVLKEKSHSEVTREIIRYLLASKNQLNNQCQPRCWKFLLCWSTEDYASVLRHKKLSPALATLQLSLMFPTKLQNQIFTWAGLGSAP